MNEDSRLTQWAHEMLTEAGIRPETADLLDQAIILLLIVLIAWAADLVCRFLHSRRREADRPHRRTKNGKECWSNGRCCASFPI